MNIFYDPIIGISENRVGEVFDFSFITYLFVATSSSSMAIHVSISILTK
jgi:hypothetical protein